ncbi:MAG TPA: hypothetical protein VEG28_05210, partial [Dehalococcoidia bacterium]|nr:hypothetical protein [Dehalococcoidia bacterium]
MKKRTKILLGLLVTLALTLPLVMAMPGPVLADSSPPGANATSVGLSISVRDASTHAAVSHVRVGEALEFVMTLSIGTVSPGDIAVDYENGTLALKIGSGSYLHVAGYGDTPITVIPEVSNSTPFTVTAPFTYTVNTTDIGAGGAPAGKIKFDAAYGGSGNNPLGTDGWLLYDPPEQGAYAGVPAQVFVDLPSINLTKYVWDGSSWQDANSPTGPLLPSSQNPVTFKFVITNTGNVVLNVTLADLPVMGTFYDNQACTIPHTFPTSVAA